MNETPTNRDPTEADAGSVGPETAPMEEGLPLLEQTAEASLARMLMRFMAVGGAVLALALLLHALPLRKYVEDLQSVKAFLASTGAWAPLLTVVLGGAVIAVGFPRTVFSLVTGTLYGVVWGLLLGHAAAMTGTCLTFYAARLFHAGLSAPGRRGGKRVLEFLNRSPGMLSVILVRQLPVPGVAQNVALALTQVGHSAFLLGSLVGMLPVSILFSLIGAGIGKADAVKALAPTISALFAAMVGLLWLRRHLASRRQAVVDPA